MMTSEILPHPDIQTLKPYVPGISIEEIRSTYQLENIIKLASNENPLGCSPNVLKALNAIDIHKISLYPAPKHHRIYMDLSEFLHIDQHNILVSNGSDPIFGLLLNCFALHQNKHLLTHEYAFSTYAIQAKTLGIHVKLSKVLENWVINIDNLIKNCSLDTGLIIIANPNNPTGTLISYEDILYILKKIPPSTLLVIDEAYFEYAQFKVSNPKNIINLLNPYPNLVITRTFSKAYGLASLRAGYVLAHKNIIEWLNRIQLPFSVNLFAMEAASAALSDQAFIKQTLHLQKEGHQKLTNDLNKLNLRVMPSFGNFICVDFGERAQEIALSLQQQGIIIRSLIPYNLNHYLRITIGTPEQNTALVNAIKHLL